VNDVIGGVKKIGSEVLSEVKKSYLDKEFYRGYDTATRICVRHISHKVAILRKKIKESKSLSKDEQFLMIHLEDLLKELEERFSKSRFIARAKIVKKDSQINDDETDT
jgi:hypothetical protein